MKYFTVKKVTLFLANIFIVIGTSAHYSLSCGGIDNDPVVNKFKFENDPGNPENNKIIIRKTHTKTNTTETIEFIDDDGYASFVVLFNRYYLKRTDHASLMKKTEKLDDSDVPDEAKKSLIGELKRFIANEKNIRVELSSYLNNLYKMGFDESDMKQLKDDFEKVWIENSNGFFAESKRIIQQYETNPSGGFLDFRELWGHLNGVSWFFDHNKKYFYESNDSIKSLTFNRAYQTSINKGKQESLPDYKLIPRAENGLTNRGVCSGDPVELDNLPKSKSTQVKIIHRLQFEY